MFKHILRVAAVAAIGIGAAVAADMLWPEREDQKAIAAEVVEPETPAGE